MNREDVKVDFIQEEFYADIERTMPIVCVDIVLVRRDGHGAIDQVGLIERLSPYGSVWCHLGGRVRRGEPVADALKRHLDETVAGASIEVGNDPQPKHVYQWFPDGIAPKSTLVFGADSRKHAIGLTYLIDVVGDPIARPGGEAQQFKFLRRSDLPNPLWPGCEGLFDILLKDE